MRRLLSLLLGFAVLAGLAVLGDGLLRGYAEDQVATAIGAADGVRATPQVGIGGGFFVPQLLEGRYDEVTLVARDVVVTAEAGSVTLRRLTARVTGAEVPLRELVPGPLERVPVDSLQAQVLLGYSEVNRYAPAGVSVSPGGGGRVAITGSLEVAGRTLSLTGVAELIVDDGEVRLVACEVRTPGGALDGALSAAIDGRLDFRVPLGQLPYGLVPTGASASADGLVLAASARTVVLATVAS